MGSQEEVSAASLLREYLRDLASRGERKDGRAMDEMRPIEIRSGLFTKGEGEAWLSLGDTQVLVGVKVDVGTPFPDTPNKGVLMTNTELLPIASPTFEPGPPNEDAVEMARLVDRAFRGSNAIDFEELVIKEGQLVYLVMVDMYALDHDGNLVDALELASLLALKRTNVPKVVVREDGGVTPSGDFFPLPVRETPISFSFAKIAGRLMLDPSLEEEVAADALMTMVVDSQGRVCSFQKRTGAFAPEEIKRALSIAREKWPQVAERLGLLEG